MACPTVDGLVQDPRLRAGRRGRMHPRGRRGCCCRRACIRVPASPLPHAVVWVRQAAGDLQLCAQPTLVWELIRKHTDPLACWVGIALGLALLEGEGARDGVLALDGLSAVPLQAIDAGVLDPSGFPGGCGRRRRGPCRGGRKRARRWPCGGCRGHRCRCRRGGGGGEGCGRHLCGAHPQVVVRIVDAGADQDLFAKPAGARAAARTHDYAPTLGVSLTCGLAVGQRQGASQRIPAGEGPCTVAVPAVLRRVKSPGGSSRHRGLSALADEVGGVWPDLPAWDGGLHVAVVGNLLPSTTAHESHRLAVVGAWPVGHAGGEHLAAIRGAGALHVGQVGTEGH
mmetsp:Transcript_1494/g.5071  ORF Transcript_1494/g.5071 Transcript_1494/m.5071 type:complete len:340 (-) Transcript_1494:474-1493(-)